MKIRMRYNYHQTREVWREAVNPGDPCWAGWVSRGMVDGEYTYFSREDWEPVPADPCWVDCTEKIKVGPDYLLTCEDINDPNISKVILKLNCCYRLRKVQGTLWKEGRDLHPAGEWAFIVERKETP